MSQKGAVHIWIIILIIIILGTAGYFLFSERTTIIAPEGCDADNAARLEIINSLTKNWPEFERTIKERPILGSTTWGVPYSFQFIGNKRTLTSFEDGHVALASVIQYECKDGNAGAFSVLETFTDNYPFSEAEGNDVYNRYGDKNIDIHSYTQSIFRNGAPVQYDTWTEVPENIFISHSKGY